MKLIQYFLLLFPYKTITISSSLSRHEVIKRLSDRFIPEAVVGKNILGGPSRRYEGHDLSNHFQIDGPFGNKKSALSTEGIVVSTSKGSNLSLKLRPYIFNFLWTMSILSAYCIFSFMKLAVPLELIILQGIFFYTLIIATYHYEANLLLKLIREALENPT